MGEDLGVLWCRVGKVLVSPLRPASAARALAVWGTGFQTSDRSGM